LAVEAVTEAEQCMQGARTPEREELARNLLTQLYTLAGPLFPATAALSLRLQARMQLSLGDEVGCIRRLKEILAKIEPLDLPLETGLAHYVLGQATRHSDPAAAQIHRDAATRGLERAGAGDWTEKMDPGGPKD
jgi:hypothetical protein